MHFDFMYKREYFDPCVFVLYFSLVTITKLRGKNLLNRGWLLMSLGLGYLLYESETGILVHMASMQFLCRGNNSRFHDNITIFIVLKIGKEIWYY